MAGVDKITEEILQEAKAAAEALLGEAGEKAQEITAQAQAQAQKILDNSAREVQQIETQQRERAESSAQMRQRQAILSAKQEVIDRILTQAYEKLAGLDTGDYFGMIAALLKKNVHAGEGSLCLSARDLERLPEGFVKQASEIAAAAGGSLTLSDKPAGIDNGFILRYGGVEENCSLDALFAQARETLRDRVSSILW